MVFKCFLDSSPFKKITNKIHKKQKWTLKMLFFHWLVKSLSSQICSSVDWSIIFCSRKQESDELNKIWRRKYIQKERTKIDGKKVYPFLVWPLGHQFVSKSTNLYLFQSKVFLCCCVFCTFPQFCFRFLSTESSYQGPSSRRSWPLSMYGLRSSTWGCNGHFSTWSWRWNCFPPLNKLVVKYQ